MNPNESNSATSEFIQTIDRALHGYLAGDVDGFNQFLDAVPLEQRHEVLLALDRLTENLADICDRRSVFRRVGQHPRFEGGIEVLPASWRQAIPFFNSNDLQTKIHISLFPMTELPREKIDFDLSAFDEHGQLLATKTGTISVRQTVTIDVAALLPKQNQLGMIAISSAERHLGSMRAFAVWYNQHGMTTTHERGALRSMSPYAVCPNIIAGANHQTTMLVCNPDDQARQFVANLYNARGERFAQDIRASVVPRGILRFNLSQLIPELPKFLQGQPGVLYFESNDWLMTYYLINDLRRKTWQIQHL